jgi:hypothetical protein
LKKSDFFVQKIVISTRSLLSFRREAKENLIKRGEALEDQGFGMYDALHVACAEQGQADVFLTTDDKLRRLGIRYSPQLWFQEKINESTSNDIRTDSEAKVFAGEPSAQRDRLIRKNFCL